MKSYDPHMHTAEHILNRTMVDMFGCDRAFSSHLERKKSKCDYKFNRALTPEEEIEITEKVNTTLAQNLDVKEYLLKREDAEKRFNLSRLPDSAGEELRIVSIGDVDDCPCIGDHVKNTSEISLFKWVSSSFENDVLRIRFKVERR
ncbi:MAG: hypothetical protein N4A72_01395 [Bacteroidales bacterium]|nr:hypothetical protein [Bacteroidales bacterium]